MLGFAVLLEVIEALEIGGKREVAFVGDDLVAEAVREGDDVARWGDDAAVPQHVDPLLASGLGGGDDPEPVLVGRRLHAEEVVKGTMRVLIGPVRKLGRRVEPKHDEVGALERHDAVGLRPATVVAYRHPDLAAERLPDWETQI